MKTSFILRAVKPLVLALFASTSLLLGGENYSIEIVAEGLASPTGIATIRSNFLVVSEIPEPSVRGGLNTVKLLHVASGRTRLISQGEPIPINIAIGKNYKVYWTCKTAGVILQYDWRDGKSFFLPADPMNDPSGIAVDKFGDVLFTEIPTPGVFGPDGGENMVSVSDGETISLISDFEPAPTDIAISEEGVSYWTCETAGVIFRRSRAGVTSILLTGLDHPTGIALDRRGQDVSLVCFHREDGKIIHMFVAERDGFSEEAIVNLDQVLISHDLETGGWMTDTHVCLLTGSEPGVTVREYLS